MVRPLSFTPNIHIDSCASDDDLAAMYLTSKLEGKPRDASEHEEIELLLESFSKQCEEIVSEVDNLAVSSIGPSHDASTDDECRRMFDTRKTSSS